MLKKLKMTTFAVVLCLFGFVLVPAAPVLAAELAEETQFERCKIKKTMKAKKNCCKKFYKRTIVECYVSSDSLFNALTK